MNGFAWEQWGLSPLEQGLNYYLKLDPAWPTWIQPLQNKTLAVVLRPLKLRVCIHVSRHGFRLLVDALAPVDAEISGAPSTFLAYIMTKNMSPLLADGRLQLTGDIQLIQAFEALIQQVKPDWEDLLAEVLGDTLAYRVGQGISSVKSYCARGREVLGRQLTEYLQDELVLLPAMALLHDFYREVDLLRQASDRLEARLTWLKSRCSNLSNTPSPGASRHPLPQAGEGLKGLKHE